MSKKCIVHIPFLIGGGQQPSGSQIRPMKIIQAFKNIGYDVDVVSGYAAERKEKIKMIRKNIKDGVKYDFLYAENYTEPTLLTESHHLPTHPFLDFSFFKCCKDHGIKIGLFYRDVYWRFDIYKESVGTFKTAVATTFFKYDLKKYNEFLNILYFSDRNMYHYLPFKFQGKIDELPPGIDTSVNKEQDAKPIDENGKINIFYVGGIGELYNMELLFEAVNKTEEVFLTVCCREGEWNTWKTKYEKYLNDRITIVHKSGDDLKPYMENADLLSLFFEPIEYRKFCVGVKMYEYMTYKRPLLSTKGTSMGTTVEKYDIGYNINYSLDELVDLFNKLKNNKSLLNEKINKIEEVFDDHTWEARARKVAKDLS
ncbi:glycosyltransferase [Clostridium cylindrosporum]|uniref:Putative glycosyl transferase n=1 Tax=Clostridium cylindrosporum DSM 605 TaxID=1121307 RepID=A0A0J8DEG1_CLOCY|nr:glycosyltransferase [Clostridium cylindrosporum]KMT22614.1 putative glycosyl transferase [Clostridium cylindrosporum DSM 605]